MAGLAERRVAGKGAAKLEAVGEERSKEGTEEEEEEREREKKASIERCQRRV